jgi:hypothetical protein
MKKLSQLLESINEVDSILELDFKDKEAFKKYQAIHKMKPTTKVNIAGKDTTVGDEMGDDSQTPQAPKKTTGADIEKQADKSGKEKDDIEKDITGDDDFYDKMYGDIEKADDDAEKKEKESDERKAKIKAREASREKVQIAKDLDNAEQISKDPMGTAEKLGDLLTDVRGELEELPDSELADDSYVLVDDEYSFRLTRLEDDLEYGDDEEKEQAIKDLKDLTSDVERFMDVNYSRLKGIEKRNYLKGRPRTGGSFLGYGTAGKSGGFYNDNVNPKSSTPLKELSKITTRYNK